MVFHSYKYKKIFLEYTSNKVNGFTLIELIIVLAITSILSSIIIPISIDVVDRAKQKEATLILNAIGKAAQMFYTEHGSSPSNSLRTIEELQQYVPIIGTLIHDPIDTKPYRVQANEFISPSRRYVCSAISDGMKTEAQCSPSPYIEGGIIPNRTWYGFPSAMVYCNQKDIIILWDNKERIGGRWPKPHCGRALW